MKKLMCLTLCLLLCLPVMALAETVVTSFFPIYVFAMNLVDGIEGIDLHNLAAPNTGCLHDYQLSSSDMKALSRADVFLINGAGMEGYLTMAMEAFPKLPVIDASIGVPLLPMDDDECNEDHDHEEHHHESHSHDGHDHGEWNAHIWLSALNAQTMVRNLADGLIANCPAYADRIAANRDAYLQRLAVLHAELLTGLAPVQGKPIITFHEAFPYFADAYGLRIAAVINREPDDALSPRTLANLVLTVRALGAPPLFTEPLYGDIAAQTIARETGAPIYQLNPITTAAGADVPLTFYEDQMRANMAVLLEALSK